MRPLLPRHAVATEANTAGGTCVRGAVYPTAVYAIDDTGTAFVMVLMVVGTLVEPPALRVMCVMMTSIRCICC